MLLKPSLRTPPSAYLGSLWIAIAADVGAMCHDIRYSHWDEASSIVQKGDLSGREFSDINDDSLVAVQDYTFTCAQLRCFSSRAVMWTLSSILIRDATRRVRECQVHASHAPHLSLVVVDFLITNSDNQQ